MLPDPEERGDWRDFLVLAVLGLAVDLRWFEPAWPARLAVFNKMLLLDAGIYGFLAIRRLQGVGFDLRLRLSDLRIRRAGASVVCAGCDRAWTGAWISALSCVCSDGLSRCAGLALHVFLYCGSGGAFLSGVDAEFAGAAIWEELGARHYGCSVWALALQQARGAFQLAIRFACCAGWGILWASVASGAAGWCVCGHACVGGYTVVDLAAMIGWVR